MALKKMCKAKRRDSAGINIDCATEYEGEDCTLRKQHIWNMKSGFCSSKFCEGTKARSYSGIPAMTCKFWLVCPCECHELVSMMFQQSELPRLLVENPEYQPTRMLVGIMSLEERASFHAEKKQQERLERTARSLEDDGGDEIHSASGRTRKGLLDTWVEIACKLWSLDSGGKLCTPSWISENIGLIQSVPPPSVGAIDAVLRRWTEYGYATVDKKPTRFTGFSEDGLRLGLEVMKERTRLQSRKSDNRIRRVMG